MPSAQAVFGQGTVVVADRVQRHLDDAFDIPVCRKQASDIHAQAPRDGRAYLIAVQNLPFDFAGLHHFLGQDLKAGFFPKLESQRLHSPQQTALSRGEPRQGFCLDGLRPKKSQAIGPVPKDT